MSVCVSGLRGEGGGGKRGLFVGYIDMVYWIGWVRF